LGGSSEDWVEGGAVYLMTCIGICKEDEGYFSLFSEAGEIEPVG